MFTLLEDPDLKHEVAVCWNAETGKDVWRFRYPSQIVTDHGAGPRATPAVDGDRVYTAGQTGILHCLNATTGSKIWGQDVAAAYWGHCCSPIVEGRLVITETGGP